MDIRVTGLANGYRAVFDTKSGPMIVDLPVLPVELGRYDESAWVPIAVPLLALVLGDDVVEEAFEAYARSNSPRKIRRSGLSRSDHRALWIGAYLRRAFVVEFGGMVRERFGLIDHDVS